MAIKNRLKEILNEKNISQNQLVEKTGLGKSAISNIINNKQNATLETALDIAKYLNVSVEDIFYKQKSQNEAINDFNKLLQQSNDLYNLYGDNKFSRQEIIAVYRTLINEFVRQYDNAILDYCFNDIQVNSSNPLFEKVIEGIE